MAIKYILACLVLLALAGNAVGEFSVKATTGSGIGGSSTEVSYGATVKDLVNDQMQLDSQGGTLSHAFAGTGSLPYLSLAINDASGNYATAWRSVSGKTGTTTWSYDWGTSRPASGVSAWLSMNAQKAYSINGGSRASNKEGDVASTETLISSKGLTSSLTSYYTSATAYKTSVSSYQQAKCGIGDSTWFNGYASNKEGDYASSYIMGLGGSSVSSPYNYVYATKTNAYAYESTSGAYGGTYARMLSHVENKAPAKESIMVYKGIGDFGVQKNGNKKLSGSITGTADASMVYLTPSISGISTYKTAYILEPYHSDFAPYRGAYDLRSTVFNSMLNNEFATTYYSDSAVTRSRVGQMDDYWISLIDTHGAYDPAKGTSLVISRNAEANKYISPADLKASFTKANGLTILSGCNTYKTTPAGSIPLYDAVKDKAWISGGYDHSVYISTNGKFLTKFFNVMTDYSKPWDQRTARVANIEANNFVIAEDPAHKLILGPDGHDLFLV